MVLPALHDIGKTNLILSGRTNAGQLGLWIGLSPQFLKSVKVVQTPKVPGRSNLCLAIVDPKVNGLWGPSCDDQPVKARETELCAPMSSHVGFVPNAGQR